MGNLTNRKMVLTGEKAKDKLSAGAEIVYEAVSTTFGPRSHNVGLERQWGMPSVIHDGVGVAREIAPLQDPFENVGAEIVLQAADMTGEVGDGTTAATILTREFYRLARRYEIAGGSIMGMRVGIERGVKLVADQVRKNALAVEGGERLKQVAMVSAQLEDIGTVIVDAVNIVGADGVITVEEGASTDTYVEVKQGLEINKGFKSPHFITNQQTGEAEIEGAAVLLTNMKMSSMQELTPVLQEIINKQNIKKLFLVADDFDGELLATLVVNKVKGALQILPVQAPSFGQNRDQILEDIATVTGARVINEEKGDTWEDFSADDLGFATRVKANHLNTLIIGPDDNADVKAAVLARAEDLKARSQVEGTGEFEREKLLERHAKLTSGIAVVFVGAKTESEIREKRERAIDAIAAVKAAAKEGIVPGGGVALIKAATVLDGIEYDSEDERVGLNIVREACRAPFRKLLTNSGFDPGEHYVEVTSPENHKGFNVVTGKVEDMVKSGVIDPAKVVIAALENAASAGVMLSTIDVLVVEDPESDKLSELDPRPRRM